MQGCRYNRHVAFSGDGTSVVVAGFDESEVKAFSVRRWETKSGKELNSHTVEFASMFSSQLSPDGTLFVKPSNEGTTLHRWDTSTGKEMPPCEGKADYAAQIAFSADGKALTSISRDGRFRVWDNTTGKLLHQFAGHVGKVDRVALSPDGKTLVTTARRDQGIHLWDLAQRKELHPFSGHRNGPLSVAFAPDGKSVLTTVSDHGFRTPPREGAEWSVRRWDFQTGKELHVWRQPQPAEVRYAAFSPNGQFLAIANNAGLLRLIDPLKCKEVASWELPVQEITIRSGDVVKTHTLLKDTKLTFSAEGDVLAITGAGEWETATGKKLDSNAPPQRIGEELAFFSKLRSASNAFALAPGGHLVVAIQSANLHAYETLTRKERFCTGLTTSSSALAVSPDGRLIATGGRDSVVRLWDSVTGRCVHEFSGHAGDVASLAFSPDGRWLVTGADNVALVWDMSAAGPGRKFELGKPTPAELNRLWLDLGNRNPAEAAPAMDRLFHHGEAVLPLLKERLLSAPRLDAATIDRWIEELDSNQFRVRERAFAELQTAGGQAEAALKKALAKPPTIEAEERIRKLLAKFEEFPAGRVQARRAIEVLEAMDDHAARKLLDSLANDAGDGWIRSEAARAVKRLERRR